MTLNSGLGRIDLCSVTSEKSTIPTIPITGQTEFKTKKKKNHVNILTNLLSFLI